MLKEDEQKNCVYMLLCSDGSLYTGWTNNIEKRLRAHNAGVASKYTRGRLPVKLAYTEEFASASEAKRRECAIKKLSRSDKLRLSKTADTSVLLQKQEPTE